MNKDRTGAVSTANALKMAIEALETADKSLNEFFEGLAKLGVPKSILKLDTPTKLIPAINACKEALEQPAQTYQHKWDRCGERCLKCGDKDWMGGACSVADEQPAPEYDINELIDKITPENLWNRRE